jgi:hypothetical protein
MIYMQQWKVNWPANATVVLKSLRTLAFAEFIDYNKIGKKVARFYGIQLPASGGDGDNATDASGVRMLEGEELGQEAVAGEVV